MKATEVTAPTAASASKTMPQIAVVSQSLWYLASRLEGQPLGDVVAILVLRKSKVGGEGEVTLLTNSWHRDPERLGKTFLCSARVFPLNLLHEIKLLTFLKLSWQILKTDEGKNQISPQLSCTNVYADSRELSALLRSSGVSFQNITRQGS